MSKSLRSIAACHDDALAKLSHAGRSLVDASLHEGPTFRMGFDHHVQAWRAHTRRRVWTAYHTNPAFAAAYDAARNRSASV